MELISWITLFLFIGGTIIGSFLNVLSFRYQPENRIFDLRKISGRSFCPACRDSLRWYELIPLVSFCIQRARCRRCAARISWRYPIVESLSGLVMAGVPYIIYQTYWLNFQNLSIQLPFWYYVISAIFVLAGLILIFISVVDVRWRIIPDQSNILIALLGLIFIFVSRHYHLFGDFKGSFLGHYAFLFGWRNGIWLNHLAALLLALVFFGIIIILSRGRGMGMGDLKLAAAAGLLIGWPDIVLAIALAFIIGAVSSIILMILNKKSLKSTVPFGPFIALGVVLVIMFGEKIVDGYFRLFP